MELTDFLKRIEKILPEKWQFSEEKTNELLKERKEFTLSLESLNNPEIFSDEQLTEMDRKFLFLRDIAGIETLVKDRYGRPWDEFSNNSSLLLGMGTEQRERIQNHLGTLYRIRNYIIHSLSLPLNNKDFKRFFDSDINKAMRTANEYHQLILLRCINKDYGILSRDHFLPQLRKAKLALYLEIPFSQYQEAIAKKLSELTKIPSPPMADVYKPFRLPSKEDCYYLGIDTYGGLSTPAHNILGGHEPFYEYDERIIPEEEVWKKISSQIKEEKRNIEKNNYPKVKLLLKTHLSILFYLGYRFCRLNKMLLEASFNGEKFTLEPMRESVDPEKYWKIDVMNLKPNDHEVVIILNVARHLEGFVKEDQVSLNLENLPKILFNYNDTTSGKKADSQSFISGQQIREACRAVEQYMIEQEELQFIRKVHLFVRAPASFMIILGMHFRLRSLNVILYEFGKEKSRQESERYYQVLNCR